MKIIKPNYEILTQQTEEEMLLLFEQAARVCYKSEDKIAPGTALDLYKRLRKTKHESVIEHMSISVRIICDRGVTHELVRHRICSFSQESTRYANYSKEKFGKEITVIHPCFWAEDSFQYEMWKGACEQAEIAYMALLEFNATPQQARSVLPNSLKTEIIITTNIREWLHIFNLRSSMVNNKAHSQMIEIMDMVRAGFLKRWPNIFEV